MDISSADISKILVDAYQTGHAWNKAYPNLQNIDMAAVLKMDGSESDAKELVASRMASDINADYLVNRFHNRPIQYDGEIGPATMVLVDIPRCPLPDHPPPPNASFDYGDEDLNGAVRSYQEFAEYVGGTGSWPKGCDPDHPNVHSVVTLINANGASASQRAALTEILGYVERCEAEIGQHLRHIVNPPGSFPKPNHNIVFGPIPGSVIGFNYFPTPNTCNQTVQGKIDSTFGASAITLANLFTHEYKGHGDGLEHTRGGIMNPSIITINPLSWLGDPHEKTKKRYFGGVPVPTDTPPPPPPPPGPTVPVSSFKLNGKEYDIYEKGGRIPPIVIEV
jgi:hypothetical protein